MRHRRTATGLAGCGVAVLLAACAPPAPTASDPLAASTLRHEGVETWVLDEGIINVHVQMSGDATGPDLIAYAECAAAQYVVDRGLGFARHVRTNVQIEGGARSADAVYTVSPTLPRGLQTIDAEVTVADCAERGIPTG